MTLANNALGNDVVTADYTAASFADKNVGTAKPVSVTGISISGADAGNYTFNNTASTTASITPASLTISAVSDSKVYNGSNASSGTPIAPGLFSGDTLTAAQSFDTKDVTATTLSVNPGYTIHDGVGGADYTVTLATAAGTITPAPLTITATTDSKTYDGTTFSAQTPTYSGLQSGDSLTLLSQAFASKDVNGTNGSTLNVAANYSLTDSIDYLVSLTPASGTITPKALTADATGKNKTYDGTTTDAATLNPLSGVISGDDVTDSYTAATFADQNTGTAKTVTVTGISLGGAAAGDYSVNSTAATTANITAADLTIAAAGATKTYDGTAASSAAATVTGLVAADAGNLSVGAETFDSANAGNRILSISGYTRTDTANYNVHVTGAPGVINPAAITVSTSRRDQDL